jgi:hypothetical protein
MAIGQLNPLTPDPSVATQREGVVPAGTAVHPDTARVLRWRAANRDRWLATHREYMKTWRARQAAKAIVLSS